MLPASSLRLACVFGKIDCESCDAVAPAVFTGVQLGQVLGVKHTGAHISSSIYDGQKVDLFSSESMFPVGGLKQDWTGTRLINEITRSLSIASRAFALIDNT